MVVDMWIKLCPHSLQVEAALSLKAVSYVPAPGRLLIFPLGSHDGESNGDRIGHQIQHRF